MRYISTVGSRKNTIKTQNSLFKNWIEPYSNIHDLEEMVKIWKKSKLSPNTIKSLLSLYAKYRKTAHQEKVETEPIRKLISRSQQQKRVKALSKPEANKLLDQCREDKELYRASYIAYNTGMRKGEVFGLQWDDFDFDKKEVLVERSFDGPTKNGRSRIIPLSKNLVSFLLTGKNSKADNYVENKLFVKKFDPTPIIRKKCKEISIPEITFHGFRHTFATLALESGKSPREVQEILGHSKLSTTLDLYWSLRKERLDIDFL
jgi:integrase